MKNKNLDFFFGEKNYKIESNNYITYNPFVDKDTIIIRTNNIKNIKGNYVLIVDNNKGVYLKDWQLRYSSNDWEGLEFYLVKLNKNFFKPFEFNFEFDDYYFEKTQTWEDHVKTAEEQKTANLKVKV